MTCQRYLSAAISAAFLLSFGAASLSGDPFIGPTEAEGGATGLAPDPPPLVPRSSVRVVVGFEGIRYGTNGPYSNLIAPPDVQLAVGPGHVLEVVHYLAGTWAKDGTLLYLRPLHDFFTINGTDGIGGPQSLS